MKYLMSLMAVASTFVSIENTFAEKFEILNCSNAEQTMSRKAVKAGSPIAYFVLGIKYSEKELHIDLQEKSIISNREEVVNGLPIGFETYSVKMTVRRKNGTQFTVPATQSKKSEVSDYVICRRTFSKMDL